MTIWVCSRCQKSLYEDNEQKALSSREFLCAACQQAVNRLPGSAEGMLKAELESQQRAAKFRAAPYTGR